LIEAIEPVRITDAPSVNSGSAFCTVNSRPRTLVFKVLSKCSSVISPRSYLDLSPGDDRNDCHGARSTSGQRGGGAS
jgi:hypothetical protein